MSVDRREYMRAYYAANKEKWAEAERKRRELDPEGRRAYSRDYYRRNKGKWTTRPADTARKVEAAKRWKARNPEAVKLAGHLRRAKMRSACPVAITDAAIHARRAFLGERCWVCRSTVGLTWDHVKPIAAGGIHALSNLRLACVGCNSRKGAKWYGVARLDELVSELQSAAYMGGGR